MQLITLGALIYIFAFLPTSYLLSIDFVTIETHKRDALSSGNALSNYTEASIWSRNVGKKRYSREGVRDSTKPKWKRALPEDTLSFEDRLAFFEKLEKPRSINTILRAGKNARVFLDSQRPDDHQYDEDPVFSELTDYDISLWGSGRKPSYDIPMTRFYERLFDLEVSSDYRKFSIYNWGGQREEESILAGEYSLLENAVYIGEAFRIQDRNSPYATEVYINRLLYAVIKQYRGLRSIKTITQADITGRDTMRAMWYALQNYAEEQHDLLAGTDLDREAWYLWSATFRRYSKNPIERRGFDVLLGSRNIRFIERMFADYRDAFGGKKIVSISILRRLNQDRINKIPYDLGNWKLIISVGNDQDSGDRVDYPDFLEMVDGDKV